MRKWLGTLTVIALTLALDSGVHSANINDLRNTYSGPASSINVAKAEEALLFFQLTNTLANGGFSAIVDPTFQIPVNGKVSSSGKFSFSGENSGKGFALKIKAKGQLSATGRFIGGTMNLKGTLNSQSINWNYVFFVEVQELMETGSRRKGLTGQ